MENKCFLFIMLMLPFISWSQRVYSRVEKEVSYINYVTVATESFADIAARFDVDVKGLASLNELQQDATIAKGQQLKLPLSSILKPACESDCVEVFYEVQPSEGLYRIGKNFGYQNTSTLKKLNNLRTDALSKGQVLMVGYISKEVFGAANDNRTAEIKSTNNDSPIQPVADQPAFNTIGEQKEIVDSVESINMQYTGEGIFKQEYNAGRQQAELTASTFKTETGWRDGRFYVLVDKIDAGKVVKLENKLSGQVIYAKVLGQLPQVSKKDTVKIRLSSAAAMALGFGDDQVFSISINY